MEKYKELFEAALAAAEYAYAPYSDFKVGAALLTDTGEVFTGVNVENASYGATICAERVAIVKAVSQGFRRFCALAVASPGGKAPPCGVCRQFLFEFGGDTLVIIGEDGEHLDIRPIRELLPEGFRL